jgi:ankyrin repeat protein
MMKRFFVLISLAGLTCPFLSCLSFGSPGSRLYKAVVNDKFEKVRQLVEDGADINADTRGHTLLEVAASRGNLAIVEYLLSKGAQDPQRAFEAAVIYGHKNIAEYFLNAGYVDINNNAWYYYSYLNDKSISFEQRMQNVKDMTAGKLNSPYLLRLVQPENYQKMIDFFHINLADKADAMGNSILHVAASRNNYDLTAYLLENNFDVNLLDNNGRTALFYAITVYGPIINWDNPIIENKTAARINFVSDMPFYGDPQAVQQEQVRIVTALLDAGVNVNQQDKAGWTALHFASAGYPAGLRDLLISRGADQGIKTNFGRTSADILAFRR